jgi:hypothetical protein
MIEEQVLIDRLRLLPPERRKAVLDFIDRLINQPAAAAELRSPRGLCRDLVDGPSAEEIDQARRELWAGFPKDLPE